MSISDIITLANAGFTKNDISVILKQENTPQQDTTSKPTQVSPTTQTPITETNTGAVQSTPADTLFNQLFNRLDTLQQTVVSSNIATTQQPTTQTSDDIIAEILNPPTVQNISKGE